MFWFSINHFRSECNSPECNLKRFRIVTAGLRAAISGKTFNRLTASRVRIIALNASVCRKSFQLLLDSVFADFNKKNEEAFEQLRLNLLNTVNLNMGSLQDGLEMAGKRLDTFNTQIEDLTARQELASEKAVNRLTNTMNEQLDSFKNSIESFGKAYMERLELFKDKNTAVESEFFATLDKESRSRLEVVKGEIEKEFADYQASISDKISSVDNLKQDIASLGDALEAIRTDMDEVRAKAVDELSGKVQSAENLFMENFKGRMADLEKLSADRMAKFEQAVKTLDNLSQLEEKFAFTEASIAKIDKVMEWLAKTETRLNDSIHKGEETIAVLGELVEKPVPISSPDTQMSQTEKNETAKQLIQRGWSNEKIAETLGIGEGQVELIRDFYSSH